MTQNDIAKARQAIADEETGPTFISTRHGERYLAAVKDPASGWSSALDEVERLRKPIDDTPPDAPTTASTIEYARKYLESESDGNPTIEEFQASCFAMVLLRVSAARSQLAEEVEHLRLELAVLHELEAKADLS